MTAKNWLVAISCKVQRSNSAFFSFTLWKTALTLTRVQKIPLLLSLMLSQLCWSCKLSPIGISCDLVVMILNMKVSHLYVSPFLPEFILDHSLLSACSCDDLGALFLPERHPCTWLHQTVLHQLHHFKFDVCDGNICCVVILCDNVETVCSCLLLV